MKIIRLIIMAVAALAMGVLLLSGTAEALRFDLATGDTKCIAEEIKKDAMTVGKYDVVNAHDGQPAPSSHNITVRVTSHYGNSYHFAEEVTSGQFAFTTGEPGDYLACFYAPARQPPLNLTVNFDWRSGVAAKDWSNVAKKVSVDYMTVELKKMQDSVSGILEEMTYLRQREAEMRYLNDDTISYMEWLGVLSIVVCLSVSGLQVWHLKTFFRKKKLI